jgi:hypothetical protein
MPGHEDLERHRVATDGEPPEQLTLVHPRGRPFAEQASDRSPYILDPRPGRHKVAPAFRRHSQRFVRVYSAPGEATNRSFFAIPEKPGEQAQARSRPLGDDDGPFFHHEGDPGGRGDVDGGVSGQGDEVGELQTSQSAPRLGGSPVGFKTSQSAPRLRRRPKRGELSR